MTLSFDEVKKIKKEFEAEYCKYPPMNSCGISNLRTQLNLRKKNIDLKPNESLDDLCFDVGFEHKPSKYMSFPSEYKGVRVFYKVQGEIRAL